MIAILTFNIILSVLILFKLGWDWYAKNKQKRIISHSRSALIDCVLYGVSIYLLKLSWLWFFYALCIRWILFDDMFNFINKDAFGHYGESSVIDRFMKKMGPKHVFLKMGFLILSLWLITFFKK